MFPQLFTFSSHCMQAYRVVCLPSFTLTRTLNMHPSVSVSLTACLSDLSVFSQINLFFKSAHCTQVSSTYTLPSSFMQQSVIYVDYNVDLLFLAVFDQNLFHIYSAIHICPMLLTRQGA